MILGIGTDITSIRRIEKILGRHSQQFITRCFTAEEYKYAEERNKSFKEYASFFAKHWSAKEAIVKALGTGFRDGIYLKDIEIKKDYLGKPYANLTGEAFNRLKQKTPYGYKANIHLSISDEYPQAIAFVIIEIEKED